MEYKRLPYTQYFIDTSEDFNNTGKVRNHIIYESLNYETNYLGKLLKMEHTVEYAFYYDEARDVIQIHFQKTNGNSDWFTNIFEYTDKYYDEFDFEDEKIQMYVHHGWAAMYQAVHYIIRDKWKAMIEAHPSAYTEVIGWSLGSGQAILCCQDLNYNFGVKPYLYTFGSVKPFRSHKNAEQLDRYLASICTTAYNFSANNDIVTYMPPFRNFRTLNRIRVKVDKKTLSRLFNPMKYHTIYDNPDLYRKK